MLKKGTLQNILYLPHPTRNKIDIQISFTWHTIIELEEKKDIEHPALRNRRELKNLISIDVNKEEIERR